MAVSDAPSPSLMPVLLPAIEPLPLLALPAPIDVAEIGLQANSVPLPARVASAGTDMPTMVSQAEPAAVREAPTRASPASPIRHVTLPPLPRQGARIGEAQEAAGKPRRLAIAAREAPARRASVEDATKTPARAIPQAMRPFSLPDALRPTP